jgi:HAD superfamily hydrolase (TIGR01509 family)
MVELIVFDLDGVLLDAREIHYKALNNALAEIDERFAISREEHLLYYDGLPTKKKLEILTKRKSFPTEFYSKVESEKQFQTKKEIRALGKDQKLITLFRKLKFDFRLKVAVASNSIKETIATALETLGIDAYVDFIVSNQDVINPKPNPEMYLRCMINAGVSPKNTLIVEDSPVGRRAAIESGAILCPVNDPSEVTEDHIFSYFNKKKFSPKWEDKKLNVLIPMAGAGSRFAQAGYTFPKPLIEVSNMNSKPMIQVVVENLGVDANYIYIVQKEHFYKYNMQQLLNLITPNCRIVVVDGVTEGAACTTLIAKSYIDNDMPLLIANSDQFVEWDSSSFIFSMRGEADAGIVTFEAYGVKWSFVKVDDSGYVLEVAEKNPISNIGTVGIYWWAKGSDYVKYAEQMIEKNIRVNNEFYVAPVFNQAIEDGKKIKTFGAEKMWGLGTPEDLNYFIENYKENDDR